ncbi:TD and POZ domain-containing protein 3 [Caerostris extrusa]|uniref:TD and POZ domain-containing protein 3 n=1 Tax=Caerostris extrusa TaxID=172846 RepID=A0AAV4YCG8_CAEEX|nr:TD and POZ domain-containing protein 3 [Caerostris extrusa]
MNSIVDVQQPNLTSSPSEMGSSSNSLRSDLQCLYEEATLYDFTLRVATENLRVHKTVLCARSPVFKAMLTSNMKETISQVMDIPDLEIDVVRRMLVFMYTDTVDDIGWETASKLYAAADKYGIVSLKNFCSSILKSSLCIANVGEILLLANLYADEDLKKLAFEFFRCNDKQVICSAEWEDFMKKDVQLAADMMRLIYMKKT